VFKAVAFGPKMKKTSGNGLQGSLRAEHWFVLHATSLITQVWINLDPFHMGAGRDPTVME
jgi:hypothetical protein